MKKIEAIIRKSRFEDVKKALLEAVYDTSSIERTLVSLVVREKNVEKSVRAILKAAQTGEIGDGRIFIMPVNDAVRIRTGERGDIALYNAEQEE